MPYLGGVRRAAVLFLLVLAGLALLFWRVKPGVAGLPEPYDALVLALKARDVEGLRKLAKSDAYARVVAARALAEMPALSESERLGYVQIVTDFEGRRAYAWAAERYEALGELERAAALWTRLLPEAKAKAALLRLADSGSLAALEGLLKARAYAEVLALAPRDRPDLRARALLGLGRVREALVPLRDWAKTSRSGRLALADALLALGERGAALDLYQRLGGAAGAWGEARVYQAEGEVQAAVSAYLHAGARGQFAAAGLLEASDPMRAIGLYLELASGRSRYADDAAFRAWVLAGRLGRDDLRQQAYDRLSGGLGLLAGKPLAPISVRPRTLAPPAGLDTVESLLAARHKAWALGEVRWRGQGARGEARLAWAWALYALGDVRGAMQLAAGFEGREAILLRYPRPYFDAVEREADRNGIDPWLIYAVMRTESAFDPRALSPTGAKGLMQFIDATWREVAGWFGESPGDPYDPETSIRYGARYLAWLLRYFGGRLPEAIVAYNGGPGYVRRGIRAHGSFEDFLRFARDEPREYLAKVMASYSIYRALAPLSFRPPPFAARLASTRGGFPWPF